MNDATMGHAIRSARELARVASQLAYEAATLAQMFDDADARDASLASAQASIQSARRAFQIEDDARAALRGSEGLVDALRVSREALDDAAEAIAAARRVLDAAVAHHARSATRGGESDAGA